MNAHFSRLAIDTPSSRHRLALWVGVAAFTLLMIALPLAHVTALRSVGFVSGVLSAFFLYFSLAKAQLRTWPLLWVFVIWLTAALLSLRSSTNVLPALAMIWNEVIKSALIFYAAYILARAHRDASTWFISAAASLSFLAFVSIVSFFSAGAWRVVGPVPALGDYNTSAITLLPFVFLPVFGHWRQKLGRKALPVVILTAVLAMTAAAFSQSRSFWLVAAVMIIVPTLIWSWKRQQHWKISIAWVGGGLVLLVFIAALVARWRGTDLLFFGSRSVIYAPVISHLLQQSPITGFGYGHESSQEWYRQNMIEAGVLHAHNIVLSYAEQMGLPGLLAIFGIFGGLAARFYRKLSDSDPFRASLATIGLALVAGVFVKNNLDIFFVRHNLLLFFLCCGLLLGATESDGTLQAKKA
jgi:O-antigen ligase